MILCVTLNSCLDKTLTVPAWTPGDQVRGLAVREVVGGKGNNVARALRHLGHPAVRPVTFLGGATGTRCGELLRSDDGFDPVITRTESATREILTVRNDETNEQTAFFDPDPIINREEVDALLASVESCLADKSVSALTLSGSSPSTATHSLFSELIAVAKKQGVPTFLDTYGPSLEAIWGFWPDAMQVNLREASLYLSGKRRPEEADLIGLLSRWGGRGVRVGVVTDGPNRFVARVENAIYRVAPPAIEPVNPIGSGDSFLAGIVDATLRGSSPEDVLRNAVGCAVANALVWDAGAIDRDTVEKVAAEVIVTRLST